MIRKLRTTWRLLNAVRAKVKSDEWMDWVSDVEVKVDDSLVNHLRLIIDLPLPDDHPAKLASKQRRSNAQLRRSMKEA